MLIREIGFGWGGSFSIEDAHSSYKSHSPELLSLGYVDRFVLNGVYGGIEDRIVCGKWRGHGISLGAVSGIVVAVERGGRYEKTQEWDSHNPNPRA